MEIVSFHIKPLFFPADYVEIIADSPLQTGGIFAIIDWGRISAPMFCCAHQAGRNKPTNSSGGGDTVLFRKSKPSGPVDFLIAGLGNPGKQYEATRHNAGFIALEALAEKLAIRVDRVRFHSFCGEGKIGSSRVLLMLPQTFMNNSGEAVCEAMRFYKLPPERLLVFSDDISLPVGTVRVRRKGSDGGQKGLRSIIQLGGSDQFPRIKLGVGQKPHPDYDLAAWVLSKFTKEEQPKMLEAAHSAAEAACLVVEGQIEEAMNRYSR